MGRDFDRRDFLGWAGSSAAGLYLFGCAEAARGPSGGGSGGGDPDAGLGPTDLGADAGGLDAGAADAGASGPLQIPDLDPGTPRSLLRGSGDELDLELALIDGALPPGLYGHYFMVCSVPGRDGNFIINGDGLVHRVDLGGGRVRLRSRLAKTPCWYADRAVAGTADAFESRGAARMSKALGVRNQANTALVPMGTDRMLLTFDAGRPFEIDPVSLEIVTAVGHHAEWAKAIDLPEALQRRVLGNTFPLVMSTAHPCYDPHTGEVWSLNYGGGLVEILGRPIGGAPFTHLVQWDGAGALRHHPLVLDDGSPVRIEQSGHQMQVTERYVVVMDSAFRIETDFIFNPESFQPQRSDTVLYVVRRDALAAAAEGAPVRAQRVSIPREAPHFLVDYANPDGRIVVHLVHNNGYDASEWMRASDVRQSDGLPIESGLRGMLATTSDNNAIGRYVIDADGRVLADQSLLLQHEDWTWGITLYTHRGLWMPDRHEDLWWVSAGLAADTLPRRVAEAYASHPHRSVPLDRLPLAEGKPGALFRTELSSGRIADGYRFPRGRFASSPQFAPREGVDPRAGYLICTVMSDDTTTPSSSGDELWIFDAMDLARGPLCRLGHARLDLPFTLHTTWLPEIAPRAAAYRVDVRQDHGTEVAKLSAGLQTMFEREVYPHFV